VAVAGAVGVVVVVVVMMELTLKEERCINF
jgi:hypothetical protein